MTKLGPNEKLYPVVKIAMVVDALKDEGVSPKDALAGIRVSETQLGSPAARESANEVIQSYRNAIRLSRNPHFAYQTRAQLAALENKAKEQKARTAAAEAKVKTWVEEKKT